MTGAVAAPVMAQTRFTVPDIPADVAHYTRVSECLAAVGRVRAEEEQKRWLEENVNPDTMPVRPHERFRPLPPAVVTTAHRCAARWTPATAPLSDFASFFTLFLDAGRDEDAAALLARRLAAVDPKEGDAPRFAIADAAVALYMRAQPARLAPAESILIERARKVDRIGRLKTYFDLMQQGIALDDTIRARRFGERVVAIADSLTPAERMSKAFTAWRGVMKVLITWHYLGAFDGPALDSLRRSTAAYVRFGFGVLARLGGGPSASAAMAAAMATGKQAPPIVADFWFPPDSARGPRPMPGRVNLVIFLDRADRCLEYMYRTAGGYDRSYTHGRLSSDKYDEYGLCWWLGAYLRRLAERFPTLEITVVTRTHGYFMYAPPLAPAEEAAYIARWAAGHHFPGTLAVTAADFRYLDPPDNRRLAKADPNDEHYQRLTNLSSREEAYLIDRDGVIVDSVLGVDNLMTPFLSRRLNRLIDVLVHRDDGGRSRAAR